MSRCADPVAATTSPVSAARRWACALALVFTVGAVANAQDDDLVTPVRVGRADAPLTLTVWAQPDYFHLAARPAIANTFRIVLDDWARSHPAVQLHVSVMPGLELHKTKLQLAAAAGRLPDVASIDSYWLPLFADVVQPLEAVLAGRGSRRLSAVHDPDAVRSRGTRARPVARDRLPRALLPQGSRPGAAAHMERAARYGQPRRTRAEDVRVSLQRRPMGGDRLRSPGDVLGAGRRARRPRRAADLRRGTEPPCDVARPRFPARHDSARRVAALGARASPTTSS